jgi:DNA-binding transcriptional MerR regulator
VDRLPPELRQAIADLRIGHGRTLDEIIAHLQELGAPPVSRSALGRHVRALQGELDARLETQMAKLAPAMQLANGLAEALVSRVEAADDDSKLRATRQLIQGQLFRLVADTVARADDPDAVGLGPKDFFQISRSLQTLAQAERTEDARLREAVKHAEERTRAAAVAAVETVAKRQGGMSAETVDAIRRAVLGDG